jgi:phosphotransferase system HPr (HPr) family protein
MLEKTLTVTNEEGLHTRPANKFVKEVKKFDCDVFLKRDSKEAPGKSLVKLMKLGIVQGDEVTLVCDGEDEEAAFEALTALLQPGGAEA